MPDRASPLAPFKHKYFRYLWIASLLSSLGGLVQSVGAGWAMVSISGSPQMVGLVSAASSLPLMMFSLLSGALADNFDRRKIMLVAHVFMSIVSIALALFAFWGLLTPWLLLGFTFLIGCGVTLNNPAWQASMGDLVPRKDLPSAVSLNSMGFNLMRSIGPAFGGAIVGIAGVAFAFLFNAISYFGMIFSLWIWKPTYVPSTLPREHFGSAMWAGVRYVSLSPNLLKVMLRTFMFSSCGVVALALLPIIASQSVKGDALTYGIMLGGFGFGAIGGALMNARIREKFKNETIVRGSFLGFAASIAILAISDNLFLSVIALLPAGASWVLALSLFNVSVQLATPRWVVARALALYQTANFSGMTLGAWVWGVVAEWYSPSAALLIASILLLGGFAIGFVLKLPEFSVSNLDPAETFHEPDLRLELMPHSGPIMIMVDYQIAQEDIQSFLALMARRRRIRIRDGARQWSLLRDLESPDIWTETYHVSTWVEYIRHNQRRTKDDAEVGVKLRALHRGDGSPRVHRMIERQTVPVRDDMRLKRDEVPFPH